MVLLIWYDCWIEVKVGSLACLNRAEVLTSSASEHALRYRFEMRDHRAKNLGVCETCVAPPPV